MPFNYTCSCVGLYHHHSNKNSEAINLKTKYELRQKNITTFAVKPKPTGHKNKVMKSLQEENSAPVY